MDETDKRIGQPDAGDWGGLYLEILENGNKRYWLIDQKKENLPDICTGLWMI